MPTSRSPKSEPPKPPELERRIRVSRIQLIGIPVMMLIPILALFGVFGESRTNASAESGAVALRVESPNSSRYGMLDQISIEVENRSATAIDTISVAVDRDYIQEFSAVTFTPDVDEAYVVSLPHVQPGETRLVRVEIQGERYGRHGGRVVARAGTDSAGVRIGTIIFP